MVDKIVAMLSESSGYRNPDTRAGDMYANMNAVGVLVMAARGATLVGDEGSFGSVETSQGDADLAEGALSVAAGGVTASTQATRMSPVYAVA